MSIPESNPRSIDADNYFAIIPEWVLDADVSAQAVRLYGILRRYADAENRAWPSRHTLANRMRVSTKTVDRSLKELLGLGALAIKHRRDAAGDPTTNLYRLFTANPGVGTHTSPPRDTDVARGRDTSVATGRDTDVSQNQSHFETEPIETKTTQTSTSSPSIVIQDPHEQTCVMLANQLADRIADNGSKRPTVTRKWIDAIDRMIRIDGRDPDKIARAIDWCQNDTFWAANILSPDTLRRQYDRMRLQAKRANAPGATKGMAAVAAYLEMVDD